MTEEKPLGYMISHALRIFKARMVTKLKENDVELSFEQFVILNRLNCGLEYTQQDLANHLQKDKSFILRQINALLDKRYVARFPDKEDMRKKNLALTKKGVESVVFIREIINSVWQELLVGIEEADLKIFRKILEKINENNPAEG